MSDSADLVVLGAGPAGLAAAYRAATRGRSVVVLERGDRVGGAAGSFPLAGTPVDFGSHRLHPSTPPAILAELHRMLGADLQLRTRNGRLRLADRWVEFPLRPANVLRSLPPRFAARVAYDAATRWSRRDGEATFAGHLHARLGPAMCEWFYFPYARKLWGLEPEQVSAEQARRRVAADSPAKLAARLLRGSGGRTFYYPRRGYGQLWEALADAATDAGADIRLGSAADGITLTEDAVEITAAAGSLEAAAVFSTIPITHLPKLVAPPAPPEIAEAAASLEYRSMLLVYLVVSQSRYTPYDAHYIPSGDTPVTRLSEPKNYRDGGEPSDRTVLCAEIPCCAGDELWGADAPSLGELVCAGLEGLGLPVPRPVHVEVRRLAQAYPVYRVGYERSFAVVEGWTSALPRLLTFGRQGLFVHDNSHHALAMGWAAADVLSSTGTLDRDAWASARERFASHVVED